MADAGVSCPGRHWRRIEGELHVGSRRWVSWPLEARELGSERALHRLRTASGRACWPAAVGAFAAAAAPGLAAAGAAPFAASATRPSRRPHRPPAQSVLTCCRKAPVLVSPRQEPSVGAPLGVVDLPLPRSRLTRDLSAALLLARGTLAASRKLCEAHRGGEKDPDTSLPNLLNLNAPGLGSKTLAFADCRRRLFLLP